MSAERLREAAALMRSRAKAATAGAWIPFGTSIGAQTDGCTCHGGTGPYGHEQYCGIEGPVVQASEADVLHIASWHPAVALAVADLLERAADDHDETPCPAIDAALAVADAYLGATS